MDKEITLNDLHQSEAGLVIQPSGEVISPTVLQSDAIIFDEDKRQKLIQILRQIPAFVDVVKKLSSEEKTYMAEFGRALQERMNDGSARLVLGAKRRNNVEKLA